MENKQRLIAIIETYPGDKWDEKVIKFAQYNGRARSTVYRWLTYGCPDLVLDAIEFRLMSVPGKCEPF